MSISTLVLGAVLAILAYLAYTASAGYKARVSIWEAAQRLRLDRVKAEQEQDLAQRAVHVATNTGRYVALQETAAPQIEAAIVRQVTGQTGQPGQPEQRQEQQSQLTIAGGQR